MEEKVMNSNELYEKIEYLFNRYWTKICLKKIKISLSRMLMI